MPAVIGSFARQMAQQISTCGARDAVTRLFCRTVQSALYRFIPLFFERILAGRRSRSSVHNLLIGESMANLNLFCCKVFWVAGRSFFWKREPA